MFSLHNVDPFIQFGEKKGPLVLIGGRVFCLTCAEYGYTLKITEKSDVYSYGVVMLEVLTGRRAVDSRYGEGWHIVKWVQDMNMNPQGIVMDVLDPRLCGMPDDFIQEMLQTLGVALMCVNQTPAERPTMKEVVTLLLEVKQEPEANISKLSQPLVKCQSSSEQC
jgi:serine/threonine protein kinase